jgi:hypothetical protein
MRFCVEVFMSSPLDADADLSAGPATSVNDGWSRFLRHMMNTHQASPPGS